MLRFSLLVAGAALLLLLIWRLGPSAIVEALGQVGWSYLAVLMLGAAHYAMRALALDMCVLRRGPLRYRDALAIRLSGEAIQSLTFTGPFLSEPTKAWLLTSHGLTLKEGFAASITEYLICSFVTAAMSIAGLLYLTLHFSPPAATARAALIIVSAFAVFLAAAALAIWRRFYLIGTLVAGLERIGVLRGRLRPDMTWIHQMEDLLLAVLHDAPSRFAAIALVEIAAQLLLVIELFVLLRALHVPAPLLSALVIEASVKLIDMPFVTVPLQLGVSEGVYAIVFGAMGLPAAIGFAVAFLRRARTLAIAALGLAALARRSRGRR